MIESIKTGIMRLRLGLSVTTVMIMVIITGCSPTVEKGDDNAAKRDIPIVQGVTPRWRYAEAASELNYKKSMVAKMDRFWSDFEKAKPIFDNFSKQSDKTIAFMQTQLSRVHPELTWEVNGIRPDLYLSIGSEGDKTLWPLIDTMIERAPRLSGWRFVRHKDPVDLADVVEMFSVRLDRAMPSLSVKCTANNRNSIDLDFVSPHFRGTDRELDLQTAFMLTEIALGDEETDKWVGDIHSKQGAIPNLKRTEVVKLFVNDFVHEKRRVLDSLPTKPLFELTPPETTYVVSFEEPIKKVGKGRLTLVTWSPSFGHALEDLNSFFSERLSKHNERFCYLQLENASHIAEPTDRKELEREIDTALRSQKVGSVVGNGAGLVLRHPPAVAYIDLSLRDVDRGVSVLRKICAKHALSHQSWLRFYDADWQNEWIGMFADTPAPPRPEVWEFE